MKISKTDPVKTVLTICMGFLVIYLITKAEWTVIVSLVIGVLGLASTYLSKMIDFLWMKLALILGFIVPNIILSAIFYLFLFPIALISKLFRKKDPLKLKNVYGSVYESSNLVFDKKSLEHPW